MVKESEINEDSEEFRDCRHSRSILFLQKYGNSRYADT